MAKVVLDAMGGDDAPEAILDGAALSVEKGFVRPDQILLTGQQAVVERVLEEKGMAGLGFSVFDAVDIVGGDESPVEAMRNKPRSSIAVGIELLKTGAADAFVSAGSTGVVVASASLGLGTLPGIRRPGIAVMIEGEAGPFLVIDVGANPQPKPLHIQQYALMGSAYFQDAFKRPAPRVGLLNIGAEAAKGNSLTRETKALIDQLPINFVGNVEGVDLFTGRCDVVVCDGFVGNVMLKVSEGLAEYILRTMGGLLREANAPEELLREVLGKVQPKLDYSTYGGALLLGANGIVTICHGRSGALAISNAIRFAVRAVGANVNAHIVAMAAATGRAT